MDETALNFALSEVHGRYPESGVAVNTQVKELVYVMQGSGELWMNDEATAFEQGDALLVEPGERYYFQGDFTLAIACNPAFTPEQHQHIV